MKKFFKVLTFAVLGLFMLNTSAFAVMQHYQATVYKRDVSKYGMQSEPSANIIAATGITYKVLALGSTTAETIYSGAGWGSPVSSKTNPVTTTVYGTDGGRIDFWCDPTDATDDTYVDLLVTDTTGTFSAIVRKFSPKMHSIVIDETPGIEHTGVIWFSASNAIETSTGSNFLYDTLITDVRVQVVTANTGNTIKVGLASTESGANDGFRTGVSLTTTGYVKDTAVPTKGANSLYWPVSTYGNLLATAVTGGDNVVISNTLINTLGGIRMLGHVVTGSAAKTLTYITSSGDTSSAGYIYVKFTVIH